MFMDGAELSENKDKNVHRFAFKCNKRGNFGERKREREKEREREKDSFGILYGLPINHSKD